MLSSLVVVLLAGNASAEEIRGVVTKSDTEKNTITVTVDGKDRTLDVAKDVRVSTWSVMRTGRRGRSTTTVETILTGGLRNVQVGTSITLNVEKKDERQVVSSIQLDDQQQVQPSQGGRRRRR
jgi:hypothetical protein